MKKRLAKLILSDKTPKNRIVKNNNSSSIETVYKLRNRSMDLTNYSKRFYLPDKLRDRVASQKNIS